MVKALTELETMNIGAAITGNRRPERGGGRLTQMP
jgi:hypothetical protein